MKQKKWAFFFEKLSLLKNNFKFNFTEHSKTSIKHNNKLEKNKGKDTNLPSSYLNSQFFFFRRVLDLKANFYIVIQIFTNMNWGYFPMMNVPYYVPYPFLPTPVQAIQQCFAFPSPQHLPGFGIQQNKEAGIINESNAITVLKQQKSKYQGLDIQITAQDLKQVSYQRTKKPWTEEQDKKLKRLCNCKYKDWTKIASLIPERSEKMCYSRYRRLKMTSRDPWTKKENQKILNLIKKHGENWDVISQHFQNRNSRTIKEHYESHLCPNVNKDDWTLQEDLKLIDLLKQYGKHWQYIKQFMDGRTQLQIKNRFYGRINKIAQAKRLKHN